VFGEIRDEHEPAEDYRRDDAGRLIVAGSFHVDRLDRLTDFRPPENTESTTVGGLASEWFGRVPHAGESISRDGIMLEILSANVLRVEQVRVTKIGKGVKCLKFADMSIMGRPNAGKSTLLNALTGVKLAIVSDKPQTTRTSLQGVLTEKGAQIVFVDTPGIHKSDNTINRRMMRTVRSALDRLDVLLFVADGSRSFGEEDEQPWIWCASAKRQWSWR